jgi:polyisoprenyl-phosphate glycosyltransferase
MNGKKMKKYSVVIPLFNEEELVTELYNRLKVTMDSLSATYEIVFVDDGSVDETYTIMMELAGNDPHLTTVKLTRNFGQESSLLAGIEASSGEEIILMDGDLQDPPELIPLLVKKKNEGFDVVYAVKEQRKESALRELLTFSFYKVMHFLGKVYMPINAGVFSVINREIGLHIVAFPEKNKYFSGLRAYMGYKQTSVTYEREPRRSGRAKSILELMRMGLNAVFSFSIFPLRLFMCLGAILNVISIFVIAALFYLKVSLQYVHSNDYMVYVIVYLLFQNSVGMALLVLIAEYVGRTHEQVKKRPDYIVETISRNFSVDLQVNDK